MSLTNGGLFPPDQRKVPARLQDVAVWLPRRLSRWKNHLNPGTAAWLLDYLVRPRQHVGRNRQADLLGGLEIDEELKRPRLLDWNVGGLAAFENLIYVVSGAPP